MANSNPSPETRIEPGKVLCDAVKKLTPIAQLRRMQRVLFNGVMENGVEKRDAAQLATAWDRLEERKRIMQMRPAPKAQDVRHVPRRRAPSPVAIADPLPAGESAV